MPIYNANAVLAQKLNDIEDEIFQLKMDRNNVGNVEVVEFIDSKIEKLSAERRKLKNLMN